VKISKKNAEHYVWGDTCDGWHLVKNEELSVIHERMPPNTQEVRHYHSKSQQFFFVLSGSATIEIDGELILLNKLEGVEIPPFISHQMKNESNEEIEFLVISQPNSKGDRVLSS
jgi:mannose-6-phosphate isomerase-like protein (cupin superfamily)